ncbi:transposase [Paludisphaera soli]|uniref:transposase n=1 Tax=Paludisphaera soli TaxID=2712865 RepID=UPI0013EDE1F5|nr:transposase [Paludisphaera soli]
MERRFEFVPLWGILVFLAYWMRRVECKRCGVTVELVPWGDGKNQLTTTFRWFLASWAKRLSWSEVGSIFRTSWDSICRAVEHDVEWSLAHRDLSGVTALGIDEVAWQRGHTYMTLVYDISGAAKRLSAAAEHRTEAKLFRHRGPLPWGGELMLSATEPPNMATRFDRMKAEDVLKAEFHKRYRDEIEYFYGRMTILHQNIYFLKCIIEFPGEIFIVHGDDFFLDYVVDNFSQVAILQIAKLATDSGSDVRTLPRFKNFMGTSVRDEYREDYQALLRNAKFDSRIKELFKKAKDQRDKRIAHSIDEPVEPLKFSELFELTDELTRLYNVASFDTEFMFLFPTYNAKLIQHGWTRLPTDIEKILDGIAWNSHVLHLPEKKPDSWARRRETWEPTRLERFNRYRLRLGLPEA